MDKHTVCVRDGNIPSPKVGDHGMLLSGGHVAAGPAHFNLRCALFQKGRGSQAVWGTHPVSLPIGCSLLVAMFQRSPAPELPPQNGVPALMLPEDHDGSAHPAQKSSQMPCSPWLFEEALDPRVRLCGCKNAGRSFYKERRETAFTRRQPGGPGSRKREWFPGTLLMQRLCGPRQGERKLSEHVSQPAWGVEGSERASQLPTVEAIVG